ncbi:glutathione S-transferase A2-like [Myotis daubentonii]|uniref:glutathione S-transferase A2-like n=1 Tax=Myotis daubentonii TaxID=98922 RepID=UPI002873ABAF|nr:glutathione S-transferase A2-like [Myotis daubentonii]
MRLNATNPLGKDAPSTQVFLEFRDVEGLSLLLLAPPPARMVEMDGMKLAQTRAILNYIAAKYNLYGRDIKEKALIDMYSEGIADLNEMAMRFPLCPPDQKDASMTQIRERTTNRYFPAFEKVLKSHGQDYLIGKRLSKADIDRVELIYHHELGQWHGTKSPSEQN